MRWLVHGADRDTGTEYSIVVAAADRSQAVRKANEQGMLVAEVEDMNDKSAPRGRALSAAH